MKEFHEALTMFMNQEEKEFIKNLKFSVIGMYVHVLIKNCKESNEHVLYEVSIATGDYEAIGIEWGWMIKDYGNEETRAIPYKSEGNIYDIFEVKHGR